MSEEEKTDPVEPPKAQEEAKPRDEKGLTLSSRLLLRVVLEERRIAIAARNMNGDTSLYNSLTQDTLVDALDDLLFYARVMGERVGTPDEIEKHLQGSAHADLQEVQKLRDKMREIHASTQASALAGIFFGNGDSAENSCDVCGKQKCTGCGECHHDHKKVSIN